MQDSEDTEIVKTGEKTEEENVESEVEQEECR